MDVRYESDGHEKTLNVEDQKRIISNIYREEKDIILIAEDRETFFGFVNKCNQHFRDGHDLSLYREIIRIHRKTDSLDLILQDKSFYSLMRRTLEKWNMNQRGARLTSMENLQASILSHRTELILLYQHKLHQLTESRINHELKGLLWKVFSELHVMDSKRRTVGVSKALHFLLPDLVMPVDTTYTMSFFYGRDRYSADVEGEFKIFMDIFIKAYRITKRLGLTENDVDSQGWNTSVPKLIDNAIIGLHKYLETDFQKTKAV
jgi:hypothetical protein